MWRWALGAAYLLSDRFDCRRVVRVSLTPAERAALFGGDASADADVALEADLKTPVNNIEYFPPNFEGLVLGCIDADFCK